MQDSKKGILVMGQASEQNMNVEQKCTKLDLIVDQVRCSSEARLTVAMTDLGRKLREEQTKHIDLLWAPPAPPE